MKSDINNNENKSTNLAKTVEEIIKEQEKYLNIYQSKLDTPVYQQAMKSYESLQQEIKKLDAAGVLDKIISSNSSYLASIGALTGHLDNNSVLNSLQNLNSITSSIQSDAHKIRLDDIAKQNKKMYKPEFSEPSHIIIPDNPILEVIKENKKLNNFAQIHNDLLRDVSQLLNDQKKLLDDQKELTRLQLDQKDKEINDNNKKSNWAIGVAIVSVLIGVVTGWIGIDKTQTIYELENNSTDIQYQEIKQLFEKLIEDTEKNDNKVINHIMLELSNIKDKNISHKIINKDANQGK